MIRQISWFLVAGLSAAGVEFLTFLLFYYVLGMNLLFANGASFCLGLITSFVLNRQWTFLGKQGNEFTHKTQHQFLRYFALAMVNLLVVTGMVSGLQSLGVMPAIAKILAMTTISLWNFVLYKKIIFKRAPQTLS